MYGGTRRCSSDSWCTSHLTQSTNSRRLTAYVYEEDYVKLPLLKIWICRAHKKTGSPLLRSTKVQVSNRPHPVSPLSLSFPTPQRLKLVLGNNHSSLRLPLPLCHRPRRRHSPPLPPSRPIPRIIHISHLPAQSRAVHELSTEPTEDIMNARLFVVTMNRVLSYQASGGSGGSATVADEVGSGLGCATTDWQNSDIVVARDEAIYIRGIDGRGACYAFELEGQSLSLLAITFPPI